MLTSPLLCYFLCIRKIKGYKIFITDLFNHLLLHWRRGASFFKFSQHFFIQKENKVLFLWKWLHPQSLEFYLRADVFLQVLETGIGTCFKMRRKKWIVQLKLLWEFWGESNYQSWNLSRTTVNSPMHNEEGKWELSLSPPPPLCESVLHLCSCCYVQFR